MKKDLLYRILSEAADTASPVMLHFGYYPDKIIVVSGPKEPIIEVTLFGDEHELIVATTKSNMRFFINAADVKLVQVADPSDPRFEKKPSPAPGVYN